MKQSSQHFCLIPLRFQLTNESNKILCLVQHKKDLIISLSGGLLFTCSVSNLGKNSKEITYTAKVAKIKKLKDEGTEITKLGSIGETLLALIKKPTETYGCLMSIGATHMNQITKNVLCFDVNKPNSSNHKLPPMLAAVIGQEIQIYAYTENTGDDNNGEAKNNQEPTFTWKMIQSKINIQDIICVTFSYPYLLSLSSQGFAYIKLQNDESPTITNLNLPINGNAFCSTIVHPKYFVYYNKRANVVNPDLNFRSLGPVNLDEGYFEHVYATIDNNFVSASASASNIAVYNFNKQINKEDRVSLIRLPGCKHITSFDDKFFITTSDTQFYLVTECTAAVNDILKGSLDDAIKKLSYVNTDILAAIFEQLWQSDYKQNALSMLKYKELYPALYDITRLFKMIKLVTSGNAIKYLSFAEQTEDQKLAKILTDNLLAIRNSKVLVDNQSSSTVNRENRSFRIIIDTTLFEIYAYQEDIGNLSSFINECPELSNESINAFFNGAETVSRAMYLAYIGNSKDSLAIFQRLENLNTVVLDQVTRIIINISNNPNNWDFCKENLPWLFEVSPLHACKVLTSDSISSNNSIKFCSENFPQYYIIVLNGVLDHKDILNRAQLVNEYIQDIFQLLLEINDESFDRSKVAFCKCVIDNTTGVPTSLEQIKEELSDDFINVLRRFPNDVDKKSAAFQTKILSNPRVQVEIYRASGKVEEALQLLWDENKNKNNDDQNFTSIIQELENFCKESEDSSSAFQILIKLLKEKLPNEQGMKLQMGILSRNMNLIDVSEALAYINEDELVENIADFLEETYRTLLTTRKDAELDAAFAESNEFESMYQRVRLESQAIEIGSSTICPKCKKPLNSLYLLRAPNGDLYHWKCIDASNS